MIQMSVDSRAAGSHHGSSIAAGLYIFQQVVKFLKAFAKSKQIYGSNLCYLNGMTLQLMTVFVMEILYLESECLNRADII